MKRAHYFYTICLLILIGCAHDFGVHRPYTGQRAIASAGASSCTQLVRSLLGLSLNDGVGLSTGFKETASAFDSALAKLPKKKATSVRDFVETLVAFDFEAVAKESLDVFSGKKTFGGSIFGSKRIFGDPAIDISNYKKALGQAKGKEALSSSKILKVHQKLLGSRSKSLFASSEEVSEKQLKEALDSAVKNFLSARKKLGKLSTPNKVDKMIYSMVDLEKELITVGAFKSHNEETARLMINSLLEAEGLAPARAYELSFLKGLSRDEHYQTLKNGIIATKLLMEDLTDRVVLDLPLEHSPELFYPGVPRAYQIGFKKSGGKFLLDGKKSIQTDARQFQAFVVNRMRTDSGLEEAFKSDPSGVMREMAEDFSRFASKNHVIFTNGKGAKEDISLSLIDDDFIHMWGRIDATNPARYQAKMARYYNDEILFRGHAYGWEKYDEEGVLNMFKIIERQTTSIRSGRKFLSTRGRSGYKTVAEQQKAMRQWIVEEFETYNQELLDGELYKMVDDHMRVGPRYKAKESYGYSTTRVYAQGKSFAKGKTLADYGKVDLEDLKINARIVTGVRRATKDVDMARLRQFDDRFRYIYPRQQEVMGVGGAEPDSIVFIQVLGFDNEVAKTYLRDKDNPARILILKGDYRDLGKKPPKSIILGEHFLN
ncbi:MAG: hypothetical protein HN509_11190 [Halobacteriovoraceae bacterium]|jgi:hypothetical protein|nr:hypothetical protein [Halobacteriovoraceae bacterium]MBT5093215.1 hypothetical protein [Halobacteriovoraceae bacterium]